MSDLTGTAGVPLVFATPHHRASVFIQFLADVEGFYRDINGQKHSLQPYKPYSLLSLVSPTPLVQSVPAHLPAVFLTSFSGRFYISLHHGLKDMVPGYIPAANSGPSGGNQGDPNFACCYQYIEPTVTGNQINIDMSYIDFTAISLCMTAKNAPHAQNGRQTSESSLKLATATATASSPSVRAARKAIEDLGMSGKIQLVVSGGIRNGVDVAKCLALGADAVGLKIDGRGFVEVDDLCRTNLPNVHAIGDIVRGPMLAHKAEDEAAACAEDFHAFADFPVDFVGRAEGQGLLRVRAAAPEDEVAPELALQAARLHPARRGLHGVDRIHADLDQIREEVGDGTVAVEDRLRRRCVVDRLDQRRERPEVVPADGEQVGTSDDPLRGPQVDQQEGRDRHRAGAGLERPAHGRRHRAHRRRQSRPALHADGQY